MSKSPIKSVALVCALSVVLSCPTHALAKTSAAVSSPAVTQTVKTYVEGEDYKIVSDKKLNTPEIREFFSFWCGHCNALSRHYDEVAQHFKGKVPVLRNPLGVIGGPAGVESQRAFVVARSHGLEDAYYYKLMLQIHKENKAPKGHSDFTALMQSIGVDLFKYEQEYNSFLVTGEIAEYDRLMNDYKIEAVPEIVVNGKYMLNLHKLANGKEIIALTEYLLELP